MESYVEKRRERRIRDFERMVARAYIVATKTLTCLHQTSSNRPESRDELLERRRAAARRLANNLKRCSCSWGCGNGRRTWGGRTLQEYRRSLEAIEQMIELRFLDDCGGQRNVRRRGPWV
jgi:hypothetical protein